MHLNKYLIWNIKQIPFSSEVLTFLHRYVDASTLNCMFLLDFMFANT